MLLSLMFDFCLYKLYAPLKFQLEDGSWLELLAMATIEAEEGEELLIIKQLNCQRIYNPIALNELPYSQLSDLSA
jgi:hypothetical protein